MKLGPELETLKFKCGIADEAHYMEEFHCEAHRDTITDSPKSQTGYITYGNASPESTEGTVHLNEYHSVQMYTPTSETSVCDTAIQSQAVGKVDWDYDGGLKYKGASFLADQFVYDQTTEERCLEGASRKAKAEDSNSGPMPKWWAKSKVY